MRPSKPARQSSNQGPWAARRSRLLRSLQAKKLAGLLVSDPIHVHYLTGFRGEDSWLLVGKKHSLMISDARFAEQLTIECPGLDAHIRLPGSGETLANVSAAAVGRFQWSSVGVESHHLTLREAENLRSASRSVDWVPVDGTVESLRVIKDSGELATIRRAVAIAERAFAVLRATLRPEDTEKDLADRIEGAVRQFGGICSAFPPICAVGTQAALAHAIPTEQTVAENPILLVDWGARFDLYNSDLTRVLITGKPSAKLAKIYDAVMRAEQAGIEAIRPGAMTGDVDRAARQVIEDAGFGRSFNHSLGHGIGLQVHEAPGLRPGANVPLQPGMVVTVEPGIYLPGWGGVRIEDDVLVTKSGHEVLSSLPREWEENCLAGWE